MKTYHILNGDALAEKFPPALDGAKVIIREAFMEGPVSCSFDNAFWTQREAYMAETFNTTEAAYEKAFYGQLDLLDQIQEEDTVYLWFEDDLFCQVNMWFSIYYITRRVSPSFFRVFPVEDVVRWTGFGYATPEDLQDLFEAAVRIPEAEVRLIQQLWEAYVRQDTTKMLVLGDHEMESLRLQTDVIQAHLDRLHPDESQRQPQEYLREILQSGHSSFEEIFEAFSKRAGIYGYGDLQIENELKKMNAYPDQPDNS